MARESNLATKDFLSARIAATETRLRRWIIGVTLVIMAATIGGYFV